MADRNFGGLGISFYGDSDDAKKEVSGLQDELKGISKILEDIKSINAFDTLVSAVSLTKLDKLADKLDRVGDATNNNINLSTSLDSTFAQAGKSADAMAASAGLSNEAFKRMRKETAFFYDLNIDAKSVQETFIELERSGISLEKMGFSSLKEFTKFAQVAGVEGKELVENMRLLTQSYGFNEAQAKTFLDRTVKIGTELGFGAEAVKGMNGVLSVFDEKLRTINPNITAEEMTHLNDQVLLLAGAMVKTGDKPAEAIQKATDLFANLADTRKDFDNLAQGVGVDLPDMLQKLNLSMGDFASANDLIRSDPLAVVQALSANYNNLTEAQRKFVDANLLQSLNASPDWLIKGNYQKVAGEIERVSKTLDDAAGSSNKLAKSFRTGLTDQERFSRLQEKFSTRLTRLARQQGVQSRFLELNRKAYDAVGDTLQDLSKKSGPVGAATRAFLAFRVAGVQGVAISVVDSLRQFDALNKFIEENEVKVLGLTGAFASLAPQILAVVAALKFLGFRFTALFTGPFAFVGLAGAMLGGLYLLETKFEGGIIGFIDKAESVFIEHWPKIQEALSDGFQAMMNVAPKLFEGGGAILAKLTDAFAGLIETIDWEKVGYTTADYVGEAFTFAFDFAVDTVMAIFGSPQTSKKVGKGSDELALTVRDQLVNAFGRLGRTAVKSLGSAISGMFSRAFDYLLDPTTPAAQKAGGVGKFLGGAIVTGLGLMLLGKVGGIGIASTLGKLLIKPILGAAKFLGKGSLFKGVFRVGGLMGLVTAITELPTIWEESSKLITKSSEMTLGEINDSGFKMAKSFAKILDSVFFGIPSSLMKALGVTENDLRNFYDYLVLETEIFIGEFIMVAEVMYTGWKGFFQKMWNIAELTFIGVKDFGGSAFYGFLTHVANVFVGIEDIFNTATKTVKTFFAMFDAAGKVTLLSLDIGFTSFKELVLYDVLAPIMRGLENFFVTQIGMVQRMLSSLPPQLMKVLPDSAKAFMKMDVKDLRLTEGTIFDPEVIKEQRKKSKEDFERRKSEIGVGLATTLTTINSDAGSTSAIEFSRNVAAKQSSFNRKIANEAAAVVQRDDAQMNAVRAEGRASFDRQQRNKRSAENEFKANVAKRDAESALASQPVVTPESASARSSVPNLSATAPPVSTGESAEVNRKGFANVANATSKIGDRIVNAINSLGNRLPSDAGENSAD